MIADVPVGAFLSGGVNSSAVVALMARTAGRRVKTFAVGFHAGRAFNELADAQRVAAHCGTEHYELTLGEADLFASLDRLVHHFDEPFGDAAAFPTFCVSRLARQHVTVVLTGEGGDELFGGYRRYWADKWLTPIAPLLRGPVGAFGEAAVGVVPRLRRVKKLLSAARSTDPVNQYAQLLRVFTGDQMHELLDDALQERLDRYDAASAFRAPYGEAGRTDHAGRLMYTDLKTWLPDTYLEKVDKTSMAVSLEARVPILDYRLVEFALRMPSAYKIAGTTTKAVFKKAVSDLLPAETLRKRKHGFSVPTDPWFRGKLGDYAYEVLLDPRTSARGLFRRDAVERLWRAHRTGREVRDGHLWVLLNFELWAREYLDRAA